ncbi:MAG: D-alanyl-D-alanine carboxypeptidase [Clostridia bacterium]|nr:D-alanyl-D-alanine carboxypeptidase [Clostridia bacterium]
MSVKKVLLTVLLILAALTVPFVLFCPLFTYEPLPDNVFYPAASSRSPVYEFSKTDALSVSAKSAILADAESLCVFYHKAPKERAGMASTTKIMTGLLAIENLPFEKTVTVPEEAVGVEGSSIYLEKGEKMSVGSLVYGLLLESGNDAAVALACAVSGSTEAFVRLMNKKAAELGMKNTNFANPHGLSSDMHYTTAEDLLILSASALKNSTFEKVVSTGKAVFTDGEKTRYYYNHNKLLGRYEGMTGVKTGYTKSTGRCLVTAAKRNGVYLIAVTLNAPDNLNDHIKMLDHGFKTAKKETLLRYGEYNILVPVRGGTKRTATLCSSDSISVSLPDASPVVAMLNTPFELYAPLSKGDVLGEVVFTLNGVRIASAPLYVSEDIPLKKVSLITKIKKE